MNLRKIKCKKLVLIILLSLLILTIILAAGTAVFIYFYPEEKLIKLATVRIEKSIKRKELWEKIPIMTSRFRR